MSLRWFNKLAKQPPGVLSGHKGNH